MERMNQKIKEVSKIPIGHVIEHCVANPSDEVCPNFIIRCKFCTQPVHRRYLPHHLYHECKKYIITCPNIEFGCVEAETVASHYYTNLCKHFPIKCDKCFLIVSKASLNSHLRDECGKVVQTCKCGKVGEPKLLKLHRSHCPSRRVLIHRAQFSHSTPVPENHKILPVHDRLDFSHSRGAYFSDAEIAGAVFSLGFSMINREKTYDCCGKKESQRECSHGKCDTCNQSFLDGKGTNTKCSERSSLGFCTECQKNDSISSLSKGKCFKVCPTCRTLEHDYLGKPCNVYKCEECFAFGESLTGSGCEEVTFADIEGNVQLKRMFELGYYSLVKDKDENEA